MVVQPVLPDFTSGRPQCLKLALTSLDVLEETLEKPHRGVLSNAPKAHKDTAVSGVLGARPIPMVPSPEIVFPKAV